MALSSRRPVKQSLGTRYSPLRPMPRRLIKLRQFRLPPIKSALVSLDQRRADPGRLRSPLTMQRQDRRLRARTLGVLLQTQGAPQRLSRLFWLVRGFGCFG